MQALSQLLGSRWAYHWREFILSLWIDNATNETGYAVERCRGSICANFSVVALLTANTVQYTDASTARATTYRYRARATGSGGNSPYSNIATVKVP